ncbi:MAG: HgcAB-associated protein [Candidatus Jordarchaeales archaeon]
MCCDDLSCYGQPGVFRVEAVVSVDARGQIVLPKDVREKAGIHSGDKLAVVSWERDGKICCISLIRASDIVEMVKKMLGPMVRELVRG